MDLFSQNEEDLKRKFDFFSLPDGEILFMKNNLKQNDALNYFKKLSSSINWKQEEIKYYGKTYPMPRKTA